MAQCQRERLLLDTTVWLVIAGLIPVLVHTLQGLRVGGRESLKSAVAAWWWLESFSVVTLLYFKYFQLWQCCMTHRTCTLAYFNLLALRTIILVFYSQSFVDDVDSWSSSSNPTHHNNSQALPQTAWETNVASDHECMSAVSALTMDIVVKSGKGLEAWDGSWNEKLFKVCVHIR